MFKHNEINMAKVRFRRKILRWGNGYGIRLTKAEAERLGATQRTEVDVEVRPTHRGIDISSLTFLDLGGDLRRRHDDLAGPAADADL